MEKKIIELQSKLIIAYEEIDKLKNQIDDLETKLGDKKPFFQRGGEVNINKNKLCPECNGKIIRMKYSSPRKKL